MSSNTKSPIIRVICLLAIGAITFATFGPATCKSRKPSIPPRKTTEVVPEAPPQSVITVSIGGEVQFIKMFLGESVEVICDERGKLLDIRKAKNTVASAESMMQQTN